MGSKISRLRIAEQNQTRIGAPIERIIGYLKQRNLGTEIQGALVTKT